MAFQISRAPRNPKPADTSKSLNPNSHSPNLNWGLRAASSWLLGSLQRGSHTVLHTSSKVCKQLQVQPARCPVSEDSKPSLPKPSAPKNPRERERARDTYRERESDREKDRSSGLFRNQWFRTCFPRFSHQVNGVARKYFWILERIRPHRVATLWEHLHLSSTAVPA